MDRLDAIRFGATVDQLTRRDAALAAVVDVHGIPSFWARTPGFASLVLFILEQQVSLASARAAYDRLTERIGTVEPAGILGSTDEALRSDGFSRQKTRYVRELADAVVGGLDLASLAHRPDDEVRVRLMEIPGIGRWTADVYLLSCLRRPDVWPVGDRALQVGTKELLDLDSVPEPDELAEIGDRWRPHRSTAARLVWHDYLSRRGRS